MATSNSHQSTDPGAEREFLARLFSELNRADICYAVMRNYESLPTSTGGSDLDILILPHQLELTLATTNKAIRDSGGAAIGFSRTIGIVKIGAIGRRNDGNGGWWGLHIDFFPGFRFSGINLLDEKIKFPAINHRNFRILPKGISGVLGVIKEALHNERFPKHYANDARSIALNDWPEVLRLFSPMGGNALSRLKRILTSDAPGDSLDNECRKLKREVLFHTFMRQPGASTMGTFSYQWSKIRRYSKPSGMTVAILGVDGAGKSTVIAAIQPVLEAATHNALKIRHLRPSLLPPLGKLKGESVIVGLAQRPHGKPPSGKLASLVRLAYLTLDYQLGYWLWTRPLIAKSPNVVLFDRYAYDMELDPLRFRIGLSPRIAGWFAQFAPPPDLIFCLHGDPTTIANRKKELSVEETERQIFALRSLAKRNPRMVLLTTDKGIKETRDEVLGWILDFIETREKS